MLRGGSKVQANTNLLLLQDGYAVVTADGPGEYVVAFDAHAGSAGAQLAPGTVAYIGTGEML